MNIQIAQDQEQIASCLPILLQLRPNLDRENFIPVVRRMQKQGYVLAYLAAPEIVCVAGYRSMEMLSTGKILYVDDLITDEEHRSSGYGKVMLDWLRSQAKAAGAQFLELDSGINRRDAHRFYSQNVLELVAYHFSSPILSESNWSEHSQAKI